uniref:Zinc finger PMZ-type domain-containing protein n=1 Tax=Ananas comosus var. bracteatus TaxID=296719 RepID=A0A6V7PPD3_ANACO|nr:unnamed protein product [Ananas comosus var. bracteatus]
MFPLVLFSIDENVHVMSLGRIGKTLSVRRLFDVLGSGQIGIGPGRDNWFLEQLQDGVVGDRDSSRANSVLTIVSDRQKGLIDAISDIFPDVAHGYCIYHLSTNLLHAPKNTPAWRRFWAAARAYTVAEFNEHMGKMKELNPEQYKYVVKLPRHRWATDCFLGRRYSMLTSNCAETINSVIAADRTDVVDLSKKTCSCKRWDIDGIACNRAIAAISFRLRDPYDFVDDWFKTSTYRATYNDCVLPHQRQRAMTCNTK